MLYCDPQGKEDAEAIYTEFLQKVADEEIFWNFNNGLIRLEAVDALFIKPVLVT